jgi:hypothetical protein
VAEDVRGVDAGVGVALRLDRAREDGAVVGEDPPALDLGVLEQLAPVERVVAQALRAELGPPRGREHEDREQQHDEPEQAGDRRVHAMPPLAIRARLMEAA